MHIPSNLHDSIKDLQKMKDLNLFHLTLCFRHRLDMIEHGQLCAVDLLAWKLNSSLCFFCAEERSRAFPQTLARNDGDPGAEAAGPARSPDPRAHD